MQGHFTFHTYKEPFILEAREWYWLYGSITSSYHSQSYNFQIMGGCENSERDLFLDIKLCHVSSFVHFGFHCADKILFVNITMVSQEQKLT
jgi:hypothetical protein